MSRVVVVGAGLVGASAAYHLALVGHDVAIVDSSDEGAASPAGAGIATPFVLRSKGPDWAALMFAATTYLAEIAPQLKEELGTELGVSRPGELLIATTADERAQLPEVLARMQSEIDLFGAEPLGEPSIVEPDEVRARHPALAPTTGAILMPDVAQVDGSVLTAEFLRASLTRGASFHAGVAELVRRGARVEGVEVNGEVIRADEVVVAAGAWTDQLLGSLQLTSGGYPQRGQIIHAQLEGAENYPLVTGFGNNYLLNFPGGRLVFGPTREDTSGYQQWPTLSGIAGMIQDGFRLAPALASARWIETRSGLRPASKDGSPTLGRYDGVEGLIVASGLGAQGLTVGSYFGQLVAKTVAGEPTGLPASFQPARWQVSA